ncbi:MAG: spermine/spermidine synthase [Armatimonadota bacterium]|nr:spermine/spermidine synthase [Armatimonadota bacterium]
MTESAAHSDRRARGDGNPGDPVPSGREVLERTITATGEWQLQRRRTPGGAVHYEIICNGVFLMASYNRASDRALAALALARVPGVGLRVLVGGLGIGYTVQAALEDPRVRRVEVVEVEPAVVAWHRAYFADLCGRPLDDPRTVLVQADLADLALPPGGYDPVLLDTDNGPGWLIREANARLYGREGVNRFLRALSPRGVLAYWSAAPAPRLRDVLAARGRVEEVEVADEVAPGRPTSAWIYLVHPRRRSAPSTRSAPPEQSSWRPGVPG